MPVDLPVEAERLLLDLTIAEREIESHRNRLNEREIEIAEALAREVQAAPVAERHAAAIRAGEKLAKLRRTTYRSELAHLASAIVRAERRRARICRDLDAFPQFGESVPAVALVFEHDGERGFIIRTGGGRNFRFTLPAMIYRELWRADGKFERGDAVTWDGSLWIAVEDDPAHQPGKGAKWRLAAMKGRNGRDASNTPRHTRNPT